VKERKKERKKERNTKVSVTYISFIFERKFETAGKNSILITKYAIRSD